MSGFKYGYDFQRFAGRASRAFRYRTDAETEVFLTAVVATAAERLSLLNRGTHIWRAQLGPAEPIVKEFPDGSLEVDTSPYNHDRMKPLANSATEGRVNPKGISVLYVATTPDTAMSEVRPSLTSRLSLAELELCRDVRLVDCSIRGSARNIIEYGGNPVPPHEREGVVWHSINDAFTRPVDLSDRVAEYAPTQILAECFKIAGYDGVRYLSGYGTGGDNIALFNPKDAVVVDVRLMRVETIRLTFGAGS
jgi:RES domain-containing protein